MKKKNLRKTSATLNALLKRYRGILDTIPSLVYDRSLVIRHAHDIFRIPSEDMIGKKITSFLSPTSGSSLSALKQALLTEHHKRPVAVLRGRKPSHYKLLTGTNIMEENGGIPLQLMIIPFSDELTVLFLNQTYRTQRRMADLTTDCMAMVDSRQRIYICNEELQWMSGFPARKLFGRSVSELFLPGQFDKFRMEEKEIIGTMLRNADAPAEWECRYQTAFTELDWRRDWIADSNLKSRQVTKRNPVLPVPLSALNFQLPDLIEEGVCLSSLTASSFLTFREPFSSAEWDLRIEVECQPAIIFAFFNGLSDCIDSRLVTPDYTGYSLGLMPAYPSETLYSTLKRECRMLMEGLRFATPSGRWKIVFEKIGGVFRLFLNGQRLFNHADPYHVHYYRQPHMGLVFSNENTVLYSIRILRKPARRDAQIGFRRFDLNFRKRPEEIYEAEFFERWKEKNRVTDILFRKVTDLRITQREVMSLLEHKEATLQQISEEMDLAASVIQQLLPHEMPRIDGLKFAFHYMPCREIGGDFFDVVAVNDHTAALLMYDVSGHGVSAALISMMTRTLIQRIVDPEKPMLPQMRIVNTELCRAFKTHFVAYFCGILDLRALTLRFVGGGLPYPAVVGDKRLIVLEGKGTPLGLMQELRAEESVLQLNARDKILIFTDGIYEIVNAAGEMYSRKRLMAFVEARAALPVDALVSAVLKEHDAFLAGAPASDDVTLLGIEISG